MYAMPQNDLLCDRELSRNDFSKRALLLQILRCWPDYASNDVAVKPGGFYVAFAAAADHPVVICVDCPAHHLFALFEGFSAVLAISTIASRVTGMTDDSS